MTTGAETLIRSSAPAAVRSQDELATRAFSCAYLGLPLAIALASGATTSHNAMVTSMAFG